MTSSEELGDTFLPPPNLCWRLAIAVNNEKLYFSISNTMEITTIVVQIERDDNTLSLSIPYRKLQSFLYDMLLLESNAYLFFDHIGGCMAVDGCFLLEVFFSSPKQIIKCLDAINVGCLPLLFQEALAKFASPLSSFSIETTLVIFSNLNSKKLNLVSQDNAQIAFKLLYSKTPSISLFHVNDPHAYGVIRKTYDQILAAFPDFFGEGGRGVYNIYKPEDENKLMPLNIESNSQQQSSTSGPDIPNDSSIEDSFKTEESTDNNFTFSEELTQQEMLYLSNNIPVESAEPLGVALGLSWATIRNIVHPLAPRSPESTILDILYTAKKQRPKTTKRKHYAIALSQIKYVNVAKKIDPTLDVPELKQEPKVLELKQEPKVPELKQEPNKLILVDGSLKFYDSELAREHLHNKEPISFWIALHEQIASAIASSLEHYSIEMVNSFVSSFTTEVKFKSVHHASLLVKDIADGSYTSVVQEKLVTLGFKGRLEIQFQMCKTDVTPENCVLLYSQALVSSIYPQLNVKHPSAKEGPQLVTSSPSVGEFTTFTPKVSSQNKQMKRIYVDKGGMSSTKGKVVFTDKNEMYFHIRKCQPEAIELINSSDDLTEPDDNGYLPIHHAAQYGNTEAMIAIIHKGISVDIFTTKQLTPLHVAANFGQLEVSKLLLSHNANTEACNEAGFTPLHIAAYSDHPDVLEILLLHGAFVHAQGKNGMTPLHLSAAEGNSKSIQTLIKHGANSLTKDAQEETPIHLAVRNGKYLAVKTILEMCSGILESPECLQKPLLTTSILKKDVTMSKLFLTHASITSALHIACKEGIVEMIELVIRYGADPTMSVPTKGTPLHSAIASGQVQSVRKLLEMNVSPNTKESDGISALTFAVRCKQYAIVDVLIKAGANVNEMIAVNPTTVVPLLQLALSHRQRQIIESILHSNCDIDALNSEGKTALHVAVTCSINEVIDLLCEQGANVNAKTSQGGTPLIIAIVKKNKQAVFKLLEYDADVNIHDNDKVTPLMLAFRYGLPDVAEFLIALGATFDVPNKYGDTAFDIACQYGGVNHLALMLNSKPDILNQLNARDRTKIDPPLRRAILNPKVLSFLLENGENADMWICNAGVMIPVLHDACFSGYIKSMEVLLHHKANPDIVCDIGTALHCAVLSKKASVESLEVLLEAKADCNIPLNETNGTPLIAAVENGFYEKAKILLKYGANPDTEVTTNGFSSLHIASFYNHHKIIELLLTYVKNPNSVSSIHKYSPLYIAVAQENQMAMQVLLKAKCDLNVQDSRGNTILLRMILAEKYEMVLKLIEFGADPNTASYDGMTPLIAVVKSQHATLVTRLIKKGAIVNQASKTYGTPLHMAVKVGSVPMVKLLLSHGADKRVKDDEGLAPGKYASTSEVIELLSDNIQQPAESEIMQKLTKTEEPLKIMEMQQASILAVSHQKMLDIYSNQLNRLYRN